MSRVTLTALGAGGMFCATFALLHFAQGSDSSAELGRFGRAYAVVQASYVDAPKDEQLVEGAISGMLGSLDPHSSYFDPRTSAAQQGKTEGKYGGGGMVTGPAGSVVQIVSRIEDTPPSRAGIKGGEHILSIVGKMMTGQKLDDVQ